MRSFAKAVLVCAISVSCGGDTGVSALKAGPVASLLVVAGQDQSAIAGRELPQVLQVKIVDAAGRPVSGQIVNFKVVSGNGSVFAGAALTSDSGLAKERWTLGPSVADSQRVEARAVDAKTGIGLVFGVFRATAVADAPSALAIVTPAGGARANAVFTPQPVVRIVDANGNLITTSTAVVTASISSGTLTGTRSATAVGGMATFSGLGVSGTSGPVTLSFSALLEGVSRLTTQPLSVVEGFAATITAASALTQTGTVGATALALPSVRLLDVGGFPVSGATVNFTLASGGGSISGASQQTDSAGIARVGGWVLGTDPRVVNTVKASTPTLPSTIVFADTGLAAAPARLFVGNGSVRSAGTGFIVDFGLYDRYDNPVDLVRAGLSIPVSLSITPGTGSPGATITGTTSVVLNRDNSAAFGVVVDKPGEGFRITATTSGLPPAQSNLFTVVPANTRIVLSTLPATVKAGTTFSLTATIAGADGQTIPYAIPLAAFLEATNGASFEGGFAFTTITTANGVATFSLRIQSTGTAYRVRVSLAGGTGVADVRSTPFDVVP